MRYNARLYLLVAAALVLPAATQAGWQALDEGLRLGEFRVPAGFGEADSKIIVLRVDPGVWDLRLVCAESDGAGNRTAREWAQEEGFRAATNAGMYATDQSTHVGYLRVGRATNSTAANSYRSVAAFCPLSDGSPRFRIFDLDAPETSLSTINSQYDCVVQNLRLIKHPRENRWSPQEDRWSEAALGEDAGGNLLFIFSRTPYSMHELNRILIALPIDVVAAQHLEGGPEAQLYVQTASFELELAGCYETRSSSSNGNFFAWPIPNVLGIVRR